MTLRKLSITFIWPTESCQTMPRLQTVCKVITMVPQWTSLMLRWLHAISVEFFYSPILTWTYYRFIKKIATCSLTLAFKEIFRSVNILFCCRCCWTDECDLLLRQHHEHKKLPNGSFVNNKTKSFPLMDMNEIAFVDLEKWKKKLFGISFSLSWNGYPSCSDTDIVMWG